MEMIGIIWNQIKDQMPLVWKYSTQNKNIIAPRNNNLKSKEVDLHPLSY